LESHGLKDVNASGLGRFRPAKGGSMLRVSLALLLLTALIPGAAGSEGWKLVWSDEFGYQGRPDPSKWNYETGVLRNHEPQTYTRSLNNVRVEDGHLILEVRKEKVNDPGFSKPWRGRDPCRDKFPVEFTSGSINTWKRANWLYGRFEIRARLTKAACCWPAFWTMGVNRPEVHWPACGEIDIMEYTGRKNNGSICIVSSDVHIARFKNVHPSYTATTPVAFGDTSFHTYAMEWYPDRIEFFIDGIKYHTVQMSDLDRNCINPFRDRQYLLLNLSINRRKLTADPPSQDQFVIDYVRVYQKTGAGL